MSIDNQSIISRTLSCCWPIRGLPSSKVVNADSIGWRPSHGAHTGLVVLHIRQPTIGTQYLSNAYLKPNGEVPRCYNSTTRGFFLHRGNADSKAMRLNIQSLFAILREHCKKELVSDLEELGSGSKYFHQ